MNDFSFRGRFSCLVLFLCLIRLPLWAQVVLADSESVPVAEPPKREFGRLKAALSQPIKSIETADSLLEITRKQHFLPGNIVALSQLAWLRLQQKEDEQAGVLLQEAEQVAGQITDLRDAGWAMSQVGMLQKASGRLSLSYMSLFSTVMEALGKSMRATAALINKNLPPGSAQNYNTPRSDRRMGGRGAYPSSPPNYLPAAPIPVITPAPPRFSRLRPDFIDRWIDTLIKFDRSSPQVVSQLTARKKLRDSSQELSKAFAKEGDYEKAYQYYKQYSAYKDSLTAEATTRRLASLAYKQNLLKKEAQIQLLTKDQQIREQDSNRQRQFVLVLAGCVALLIAFSLILTRNNRAKQLANRQLNEQKEALQQTLAELKTTQAQLVQSEKMASLGELTAGIAHEIQNPLNFVNNFSDVSTELITELIENRQRPDRDNELEDELLADVAQNLQKINQHGNRASSIVKGMLEHARTTAGQKEPTDLNALADEYLKLAYHGIRAKDKSFDAKITTLFDPGIGKVNLVSQEIGRVLLNVFNNAFYAVHKRQQSEGPAYRPEVFMQTKREAGKLVIRIRDNGTGVPASIKKKIFQPFFTTKPTGQGTGLGLSISYDIITKGHGGTFTLDSQEGEFTELTLTLPLA